MNYINITAKNKAKGKELSPVAFALRGNYIANLKDDHQKVAHFWAQNCITESSLDELVMLNAEIQLVQDQNTTVKTNKSLHIAISLSDGETLNEDAWRDIEQELSKALGLQEYQRICAVHTDTANHHLHIAYNLIHPETFKKYSPYRDHQTGSDVCRIMEAKYGLKVDVGYGESKQRDNRSVGAKDKEAHTYEQSFESFVLAQKTSIMLGLNSAKNWEEAHKVFHNHGLKIKKRGNGLVISQDKNYMKASSLDRSCSKNALEKRFDKYRDNSRSHKKTVSSRKKYSLQPRFPLKGSALKRWQRFLQVRKDEKAILSWKDYLMLEAGFDPLAMAIIKANQGFLNFLSPKDRGRSIPYPANKQTKANHNKLTDGFTALEAEQMGAFEENAINLSDFIDKKKPKTKDSNVELD